MVGRAAIVARQDSLLAIFADDGTSACSGLALIYRTRDGVRIMQVEPCRLSRSKPIILVTTDRRHAFRLDKRCLLRSCAVPSRAKVERGVERAWEDIRAAMLTVEVDPAQWESSYVGLFTDISRHKAREQDLRRIGFEDPLTGLPNRRRLHDLLTSRLHRLRAGEGLDMALIDIDGPEPSSVSSTSISRSSSSPSRCTSAAA